MILIHNKFKILSQQTFVDANFYKNFSQNSELNMTPT